MKNKCKRLTTKLVLYSESMKGEYRFLREEAGTHRNPPTQPRLPASAIRISSAMNLETKVNNAPEESTLIQKIQTMKLILARNQSPATDITLYLQTFIAGPWNLSRPKDFCYQSHCCIKYLARPYSIKWLSNMRSWSVNADTLGPLQEFIRKEIPRHLFWSERTRRCFFSTIAGLALHLLHRSWVGNTSCSLSFSHCFQPILFMGIRKKYWMSWIEHGSMDDGLPNTEFRKCGIYADQACAKNQLAY